MKRLIILALVLLPVLACAQARVDSPVTVEWDGTAEAHEIGIQSGLNDVIILAEITEMEYTVDLQALGYYGLYAVLVRGVEYTEPDMTDYSEWIRSDNADDVIMIDGQPITFLVESKKPAGIPEMLRIK